ncbi:hypothetical protein [Zhongshania sp.]|uniref:hypothetical protein n=1 Tax=Zhongshania sp. TaxID=1971902 RepID=UPI003566147E
MKCLFLLSILFALSSCDSSSNKTKTFGEIQAEIEASQKLFEENRQRIEAENKAREARLVEQRSYISARYVSVDEDFLDVELTNETAKDIDNVVGSLEVFDSDHNRVTSIALTNWVPGDIYLPRGGTAPARKSLALETPENRNQILEKASEYKFVYTTLRIQFVGENEINYLDAILKPQQTTAVKKIKPVNQVKPDDCGSNQISLETTEIYYPGPKCEHIGRNIDSERFKLEYIDMCRSALGITEHMPSVAKVQVSSCIYETNRSGLSYRKRICCDMPVE